MERKGNEERKEVKQQTQDTPINHSESKEELDQFTVEKVYSRKTQSPILGYHYQLPNLPTSYVPATILDTSLSHIPIYAHLKIYDLKPVQLPETPLILSTLHLQFSEDAILGKSSNIDGVNKRG